MEKKKKSIRINKNKEYLFQKKKTAYKNRTKNKNLCYNN